LKKWRQVLKSTNRKISISKTSNLSSERKILNPSRFLFPECPTTTTGERKFACPRRDVDSPTICITSWKLCNNHADCPDGEDEDEKLCLFHRPVIFHILSSSLLQFSSFLADILEPFLRISYDRTSGRCAL
jgi:Low-density lipoprotein receptor domain class A